MCVCVFNHGGRISVNFIVSVWKDCKQNVQRAIMLDQKAAKPLCFLWPQSVP